MLKRITIDELESTLRPAVDTETLLVARRLLEEIARDGTPGLSAAIERFENRRGDRLTLGPAEFAEAYQAVPRAERELLERVAGRIARFAEAQKVSLGSVSLPIDGGAAGHDWFPLQSAGCYVPGGRFPLVSSLLMTAVTARVAGVEQVWVASPVASPLMLAAAAVAQADGFLWCGGVQAIAALAYGIGGVPRCDAIVGPGNRWVTAAKFLVSDRLRIDMLAGPSELLVLADGTARPEVIAADLLAQAEHDVDARPMLITDSVNLAAAVDAELRRQTEQLATRENCLAALKNGFTMIVRTWEEAVVACQRIAPEHLEVQVAEPAVLVPRLTKCGCLFIGGNSAEALGDYGAGPNHVLPTGGTARFASGLAVETLMRRQTWLRIDDVESAQGMVADALAMAELEGLPGHAVSARLRARS